MLLHGVVHESQLTDVTVGSHGAGLVLQDSLSIPMELKLVLWWTC